MFGAALTTKTSRSRQEGGGRLARLRRGYERALDAVFVGSVSSRIFGVLRIGTALVFLVRHADWLRPWLDLEHHQFVHGLLFAQPGPLEPRLHSPMIPGLQLGDATTHALALLRTGLAVTLLFGIRARFSAGALALVSYTLFAADRFHYYHHLHLMYVTVAWLALAPIGASFSLEHAVARLAAGLGARVLPARDPATSTSPLWPLQLIRALALSVYLAAALSKLDASFLRGDALRELEAAWVLKGPAWEGVRNSLGYAGAARLSCLSEVAIPLALLLPRTRRPGVVAGLGFHALISLCMPVLSFGAQMSLLLLAFVPRRARAAEPNAAGRTT